MWLYLVMVDAALEVPGRERMAWSLLVASHLGVNLA